MSSAANGRKSEGMGRITLVGRAEGSQGAERSGEVTALAPASLPARAPASTEKGLTAREAAQVLGYDNFMTVYNKVHQGAIKVRRRGRNIRIWREDNEELFRARCA